MALADQWTLSQLRTAARRELGDPNSLFWPDAEINLYLQDWEDFLQDEFEFVWTITTATQTSTGTGGQWNFFQWDGSTFNSAGSSTSLATVTLAAVAPDMLRLDAVYFIHADGTSANRVAPRAINDLDAIKRDWRQDDSQLTPVVVYQEDVDVLNFWPVPSTAGTLILEYPVLVHLSVDTSTMQIPAWTRYSAKDYVGFRAFSRFGATQNLTKAGRYKAKFDRHVKRFHKFYDGYMPQRAEMLRPGRKWAADILNPRRVFMK